MKTDEQDFLGPSRRQPGANQSPPGDSHGEFNEKRTGTSKPSALGIPDIHLLSPDDFPEENLVGHTNHEHLAEVAGHASGDNGSLWPSDTTE